MEYLMTYGWAILIIAVVLGAIYSLGLFNSASLAPRAQPGSCQAYRPNGPGTVQYISLAGACTNELPQYAAQFNGQTSQIIGPSQLGNTNYLTQPFTISLWLKLNSLHNPNYQSLYYMTSTTGTNYGAELEYTPSEGSLEVAWLRTDGNSAGRGAIIINPISTYFTSTGIWYDVIATYNGAGTLSTANVMIYINGVNYVNGGPIGTSLTHIQANSYYIGGTGAGGGLFNGSVADVQVYNTSLDANSVKALYQEGIGGAPINLQSLVGWWPLNGNANDYSGNLANGAPTAVTYTNQWLSGYNIP